MKLDAIKVIELRDVRSNFVTLLLRYILIKGEYVLGVIHCIIINRRQDIN